MPAVFDIVKKNLKILLRSKSSALIIILGPLLLIFLVGIAFDNIEKFSLNIGVYSHEYSELSESFIEKLEEKDFNVKRIGSEPGCIEQISRGQLHTCIVFPPDMSISPGKTNEITFHVDQSKINLVWMILDTLSTKLEEHSSGLSMDLTSSLIDKIEYTKSTLDSLRPNLTQLKQENQESGEKAEDFRKKINSFRDKTASLRSYYLTKVEGARKDIEKAKYLVDDSNATDSQKSMLDTRLSSIDTFLLNMQDKIENDKPEPAEWEEILQLTASVTTRINSLVDLLSSGQENIDSVVSGLDELYQVLDNIQIKEAATIVNPITTNIRPVVPEKTYLNYMFPSLIILVVMFISILLSTTLVQMEKHSPAYFRNFITPTKDINFILGTYLTNMILVLIQVVIILLISVNFFESRIIPVICPVILSLMVITSLFTAVGMLIGHIFMSEETATLAAISTGSVFLFLSNVILPLESMHDYIMKIAQYNPFVVSENILRKVIIFDQGFSSISAGLIALFLVFIILFLASWFIYKSRRMHTFHHLFSSGNAGMKKKR